MYFCSFISILLYKSIITVTVCISNASALVIFFSYAKSTQVSISHRSIKLTKLQKNKHSDLFNWSVTPRTRRLILVPSQWPQNKTDIDRLIIILNIQGPLRNQQKDQTQATFVIVPKRKPASINEPHERKHAEK